MEGSKKGEDQVVGITSFGHVQGCGIPGLPGVYSEISFHREWIKTRGYGVSRIYPVPFCGEPFFCVLLLCQNSCRGGCS